MVLRIGFVAVCLGLGAAVGAANRVMPSWMGLSPSGASALVGAFGGAAALLILFLVIRALGPVLRDPARSGRLQNGLLCGAAGAVMGLAFYATLGALFPPSLPRSIAVGLLAACLTLGAAAVGVTSAFPLAARSGGARDGRGASRARPQGACKILDTSVIIDGRIGDLLTTGFVEGEILIPEFVLDELQGIADSSDALRRRKGRRGLEILRRLMDDDHIAIRVDTRDYPSISEVDRKLIRLAKDEGAILITTDYNLNRVAQVEGIGILNVNELANAVKPRFVPGEQIEIEIVDRGAEINQGVGYLDDGTMIVVENGRRHIGRTIKATVKSTLQTDAGRMLFAEPANEVPRWEKEREAR